MGKFFSTKQVKRISRVFLIFQFLLFLSSFRIYSQPEIKAVFTDKAPVIDGFVNDDMWDGKARITDEGWEGELIIPFKTMGFNKASGTLK